MKSKSKKIEIGVCILNIILIIVMIVYLFHAFAGKKEVATSSADTVEVDDTEFSFDEANDVLKNIEASSNDITEAVSSLSWFIN